MQAGPVTRPQKSGLHEDRLPTTPPGFSIDEVSESCQVNCSLLLLSFVMHGSISQHPLLSPGVILSQMTVFVMVMALIFSASQRQAFR
ncbi:hypothetical protein SKAU_G00048740 [Synaphobranchus kaupii]|uniref:Uncharacterized protein n=1 Tax=Synaphobranchus kaupii TaxID=118154 RepID=A0A9Q1J7D6_SYNKA|nr:hypothetical protein SKAU_G00048740 [Synaphobranchus kaupii]